MQRYHPVTGLSWFEVDWVSKASAKQRAGRAGRTAAGHCYRLYSSAVFEKQFEEFAPVELLQKPLEDVVMRVKKLGVQSVQDFPFPSPPAIATLRTAVRNLRRLGSLSSDNFFKYSSAGEKVSSVGECQVLRIVCSANVNANAKAKAKANANTNANANANAKACARGWPIRLAVSLTIL